MRWKGFFTLALVSASVSVVAGVLAAGGCSDDTRPAGSDHPAAAVVGELQEGFEDGDAGRICEGLARGARAQAAQIIQGTPATCEQSVRGAFRVVAEGGWGGGYQPVVGRVGVRGRRAVVIVEDDGGWRADVALEKEAGAWRLAGFLGLSPEQFVKLEDGLRRSPFPSRGSTRVEARRGSGEVCPRVRVREETEVSGGCVFRVSGANIPVRVLTPFGRFKISDCSVRYRVAVGPGGRAWATDMAFANAFEHGCAEIEPCLTDEALFRPWAGWMEPNRGSGSGYTHRMLICLRTHIGMFGGELVMRLARRGAGWRAMPSARGTTGFRLDGELTLARDDFYLQSP